MYKWDLNCFSSTPELRMRMALNGMLPCPANPCFVKHVDLIHERNAHDLKVPNTHALNSKLCYA